MMRQQAQGLRDPGPLRRPIPPRVLRDRSLGQRRLRRLLSIVVGCGFVLVEAQAPVLECWEKGRSIGRTIVVSYTAANGGVMNIDDAAVRMGLPGIPAARVVHTSVFPSSKGMQRVDMGDAVYWTNVTVPAKRRRKFTLKLGVVGCSATTLDFQSFLYLVSANGTVYIPCEVATSKVRDGATQTYGGRAFG